jgi:hypothetical protein
MNADSGSGTQPSQDPVNPEWNRWLSPDESEKRRGTKPHAQAAHLQALAARLGVDPESLAERIPADTLRRLKYPMLEHVEEDGKHSFKHDVGIIVDGRRALLVTDHSDEPIERNAPQPRDSSGKFTK